MTNPVKRLVSSVVMKARCLSTTIRKELTPLRRVNASAGDFNQETKEGLNVTNRTNRSRTRC